MSYGAFWVLGLLGVAYLVVCAVVFVRQESLIYFPESELDGTPADVGLVYEDARFRAGDGVALHAWYVPGPERAVAILLLHGNAGNVSNRIGTLEVLHRLGAAVLVLDYRGYGASEGRPTERGLRLDARAAFDWLVARGHAPSAIVILGRSLGGTLAVALASDVAPRALVVEASFPSVVALGQRAYPFLPIGVLCRDRYDAAALAPSLGTFPKLFVHSRSDETVPLGLGRALYEAASEPKRFVEIGGRHTEGLLLGERTYLDALRALLEGTE